MSERRATTDAATPVAGRLFRKYALAFGAVVCLALVTNGLVDIVFSYREQRDLLVRIQRGQAQLASNSIGQFVREIENQMAWATLLPWNADALEEWRFDAVRMLRQVPAITELIQLDGNGRELFRMSRHAKDVIASQADHSNEPAFTSAMTDKTYYGPVYFLAGSEPYMTLALAGTRRSHGVVVGQVNLKFIWDVVSQIKVGSKGVTYVVDTQARLIAHPDISLVLRNTDMSRLPQVQAGYAAASDTLPQSAFNGIDLQGRPVLSVPAVVTPLRWHVFVDLPGDEAYGPLYDSLRRSGVLLLAALLLAFAVGMLLARRMVVPIRALRDGAVQIGGGDLSQRMTIKTGDELQELGDAFNAMAHRLEESYSTLERKVDERTRQLEVANQAKSRFLAAASHDLRQPLHALGMFVGQLRSRMSADERRRVIGRIETALSSMKDLFNALLDISKLDAGALKPSVAEFPIARVLKDIETTFADAARHKGLSLRIVSYGAWVRSDFALLEQIVFNLVSNAVRYTDRGRVLVGCRRRSDNLLIEVWDTGPGIPPEQQHSIFGEFYRGETSSQKSGLGLGLAIVERLCRLLAHPISVTSSVGKGSCFSVTVPLAAAGASEVLLAPAAHVPGVFTGKRVLVIDDDPLVRDGMAGLLRHWGCQVLTAESGEAALARAAANPPDLIVSDFHLPGGKSGIDIIAELRKSFGTEIPAFLMSGDTQAAHQRRANASGLHLLHKPVGPMALRSMLAQVLRKRRHASRATHSEHVMT